MAAGDVDLDVPPLLAVAPLEVRTTRHRDRATLHLSGDLDVVGNRRLRDAVAAVLERGVGRVDLDLAGLGFVDAAGLGALIGARRRAAEAGASLVVAGATDRVRDVLDATGLAAYLSTP